jgi:hypothetical protein
MSSPKENTPDNDSKSREAARRLVLEMEEGAAASRSLKRIKGYSAKRVARLAKEGASLREQILHRSAEAWVRKK